MLFEICLWIRKIKSYFLIMFIAVTFNTNKHTHNSYAPVVPYFLGVWPEITDCSFRNNFVEIANRLTDALFLLM